MPNRPTLMTMPAYLVDFKCIGPQCEDHCCYGWDIFVDRQTYRHYRKASSGPLGGLFEKAIRRNRETPSAARYAKILRSGDNCPFLTQSRLCRIQAELGEAFLPDICAVFPRHLRARQHGIDVSASLACPEIARRALAAPEGIEIIQRPVTPEAACRLRAVDPGLPPTREETGLKLRELALALLQDRRYALWQRLFRLGVLFEAASQSPPRQTVALVDVLANEMDAGALHRAMESVPVLTGLQLQIVRRLHDEKIKSVHVQTFRDCTTACFSGLDFTEVRPFDEEIGRRYDRAYEDFYRPFFDRHGHLLENYLVNDLLHHDLCFQQGPRLYENYVTLMLNFAMLKTYLIGMSAFYGKDFTPDRVVRLIYAFTKVIEPDTGFRQYALDLLTQSGCTDLLRVAVLLKNN